jgi:hypothetical protein
MGESRISPLFSIRLVSSYMSDDRYLNEECDPVYRLQIGRWRIEVLLFKVRLPAAILIFFNSLESWRYQDSEVVYRIEIDQWSAIDIYIYIYIYTNCIP